MKNIISSKISYHSKYWGGKRDKAGRKKTDTTSVIISVRCPIELQEKLKALAKEEGKSLSKLILEKLELLTKEIAN